MSDRRKFAFSDIKKKREYLKWYSDQVTIRIFDSYSRYVEMTLDDAQMLFNKMVGKSDPSVSSCLGCKSRVVVASPFLEIIDQIRIENRLNSDVIGAIDKFIRESDSIHFYIWEENNCIHRLWRDPLAFEWSQATQERLAK